MFSFQQIINTTPQIKEYFTLYANNNNQCMKLATELIKQSISNRKVKSNNNNISNNINSNNNNNNKFFKKDNKNINQQQLQYQQPQPQTPTHQSRQTNPHYNVAYVKHNRFLTTSQKKQITPKVTQIIPISPQKVFIYGKPKVKLDQYTGCEIHHDTRLCEDQQKYLQQGQQNIEKHNYVMNVDNNLHEQQQENLHNKNMQIPYQYEEYLSPKNNSKINKKKNNNMNNNNKTSSKRQQKQQQQQNNKTISVIQSPKNNITTKEVNTNSSLRLTSPKPNNTSSLKINPHITQQNYTNIPSKIKQLITRDKRTRQVQKQVQRQKQQIQQLQEQQMKLLIKQHEQQMKQKQLQQQHKDMLMREQIRMRQQCRQRQVLQEQSLWRIKNAYDSAYNDEMIKYISQKQQQQHQQNYNIQQQQQLQQQRNQRYHQQLLQQHQYQQQPSSLTTSEDEIVNLHNHKLQSSREECYQCQIQRLRKRKQKAKKAIKLIEKEQAKRNQLLIEIAQSNTLQQQQQQLFKKTNYKNIGNNNLGYQGYSDSMPIY